MNMALNLVVPGLILAEGEFFIFARGGHRFFLTIFNFFIHMIHMDEPCMVKFLGFLKIWINSYG